MAKYRGYEDRPRPKSAKWGTGGPSRRQKIKPILEWYLWHVPKLRKEFTEAEAKETLELLDQLVDAGIREAPLKAIVDDVLFPQEISYWSFDLYPKFPAEVRTMIIIFTFLDTPCEQEEDCDHMISLGRTRGQCDRNWRKLPVASRVNQEFRHTFLKHYAVVFEQDFAAKNGLRSLASKTRPLCFRPIKDNLYIPEHVLLSDRKYAFVKWIKYIQVKAPGKIEKIQEISISIHWSTELRVILRNKYGPLGKILPFTGLRKLNLTFHLWSDMSREEQRAAKAELKAELGVFFIAYKKNFTNFKKVITKIGL